MMILGYFVLLIIAFYLLAVICEEFFIPSLDIISHKLKLSPDVAGATFMAVGSSAPEFFTVVFAILKSGEQVNVGTGTIVGSAMFNVLVIIGLSAMFRTAKLTWQPVLRDIIFYIVSLILLYVAFMDQQVVLWEALMLSLMYVVYVLAVVNWKKILPYEDVNPIEIVAEASKKSRVATISKSMLSVIVPDCEKHPSRYLLTFGMSIAVIAFLSNLLVESAVGISQLLSISPTIIALTVIAAGTSIPDTISSVIVAKAGRGDMAVSNALGSNIFNIMFALGVPWMIMLLLNGNTPIPVDTANLDTEVLLLLSVLFFMVGLFILRKWTIGLKTGVLFVGMYVTYILYQIISVITK